MRGQSAIEYMLVFSVVMVIFAAVTFGQIINPAEKAGRDAQYISQGRAAADAIAGAINLVYANGPGAVKSVSVSMGSSWDLELDNAENKLRITIQTFSGTEEEIEDNLWYAIDNYHSLNNLSLGTYTVIVEWSENKEIDENIDNSEIGNYKIFIYIKPQGW